jgi:hypothetical protein
MKIYFITILFLFFNCSTKINPKKETNTINMDLLCLKNHLFIIYLEKLEFDTNSKYGINKNDSCYLKTHIQDVSTHQYINISRYNLNYINEDENSKKLIKKWIAKDDFDLIPIEDGDKIKHSFNYFKALEFYNSKDLNNYIDSVRTVELTKSK